MVRFATRGRVEDEEEGANECWDGWWVIGTKLLLLCPLAVRGKRGSGRWCKRGEERALIGA